ncbi:hypothetical protein ACFXPI_39270 [Streptomyces sp. NPDC059104]|uniref:hypothetical protein n=1 Tax=Streptomyces sp. NPDC059104 TaxID=3346729 RepID=UPI0036904E2C
MREEPPAPAAERVAEAPLPVPVLPPAPAPAPAPAPVADPEPVQPVESEYADEREPEGVIPSQTRTTDTPSVFWQDPRAMYEAIWANMSPKHRAELTMLLIENNRRG